jgi:hypothetical protein
VRHWATRGSTAGVAAILWTLQSSDAIWRVSRWN